MAKQNNDTVVYELKEGRKVVYIGTTNDPDRREAEHLDDGKRFSHMLITTRKMTEDGAKKRETDRLYTYRKNQGKNPKYNKDNDG